MAVGTQQNSYWKQVYDVVTDLLDFLPARPFAVRLPDGTRIPARPATEPPAFTLVLKRPAALRRMFLPPSELAMGEGYLFDDFDIEGDIVAAFRFIDQVQWPRPSLLQLTRLAWRLLRLERMEQRPALSAADDGYGEYVAEGRRHTQARDQRSVRFHYDLSNDFYRLWLDEPHMLYTCAYFADADEDLAVAQRRKLNLIGDKLDLQRGDHLLDVGCGWGGLVIHAAAEYGAEATGITLSQAQADEANARIAAAGLQERCRVFVRHYEQYAPERPVTKLACIGMSEHVGEAKIVAFFCQLYDMLVEGGRFLLQVGCSGLDQRHAGRGWMDRLGVSRKAFMHKYSFPDSELLDIATVLAAAERAGFELRDVQSLREHYPLTLRHWLWQLENKRATAIAEVGQAAYRSWRLILAGYLHLLAQGHLSEYHVLFARPCADGSTTFPLLRDRELPDHHLPAASSVRARS